VSDLIMGEHSSTELAAGRFAPTNLISNHALP